METENKKKSFWASLNSNKKKKKYGIIALVLAVAMVFTGTWAWQSLRQSALNETVSSGNPGGRLHDEFNGALNGNGIKNVFAENFADSKKGLPVIARIMLREYLEMGEGSGKNLTTPSRAVPNQVVALANESPKSWDVTTWTIHKFTNDTTVNPIRQYIDVNYGGQTNYMPTFNRNMDSWDAEINGTLTGEDAYDDSMRADDATIYEDVAYTNFKNYQSAYSVNADGTLGDLTDEVKEKLMTAAIGPKNPAHDTDPSQPERLNTPVALVDDPALGIELGTEYWDADDDDDDEAFANGQPQLASRGGKGGVALLPDGSNAAQADHKKQETRIFNNIQVPNPAHDAEHPDEPETINYTSPMVHFAKPTLNFNNNALEGSPANPKIMSVSEYMAQYYQLEPASGKYVLKPAYPTLNDVPDMWVYDEDGWAYWNKPLQPETATGLLVNSIQKKTVLTGNYYYAMDVVAQFAGLDDIGSAHGSGFYDPTAAGREGNKVANAGISDNAKNLLSAIDALVQGNGDINDTTGNYGVKADGTITQGGGACTTELAGESITKDASDASNKTFVYTYSNASAETKLALDLRDVSGGKVDPKAIKQIQWTVVPGAGAQPPYLDMPTNGFAFDSAADNKLTINTSNLESDKVYVLKVTAKVLTNNMAEKNLAIDSGLTFEYTLKVKSGAN